MEFLKFKGIFSWRQGNHSVFDAQNKVYRSKGKYELLGVSDILGILRDGRFLAIEVKKSPNSRPSKHQVKFIDNVNSNGGIGFVAWDIEIVEKNLKDYL